MPADGARLWYRGYDTGVGFNENYVTRLYLDAGYDVRVWVLNASGVAIRSSTRHVWSGTDAAIDAWTDEYVRTLNGDGSDPCAQVDVSQIVRPDQLTAGAGEPLEPASLHASELRATTTPPTVLHRFEFVTSAYVSLRHHLAVFDGRCRRLAVDAAAPPASDAPSVAADAALGRQADVASAVAAARTAATTASAGAATAGDLDAATATLDALRTARADAHDRAAAAFDALWRACFDTAGPGQLPAAVRVSVARAQARTPVDLLLLESPEPIAWERVAVTAVTVPLTPMRQREITVTSDFGRPDMGMTVEFSGIAWTAGVELWVVDGALVARADLPMDLTLILSAITAVELELQVGAGGAATIITSPALATGPTLVSPASAPINVSLAAPAGTTFTAVRIVGSGTGLRSCRLTGPFVPNPPAGPLRIVDVRLPTATQPLDHEITLLATDAATFEGYTIRWTDAVAPGASDLYAVLSSVALGAGQRIRLVPGRASAPVVDDALVQAGGPGSTPPATGALYQLVDRSGVVVHEYAALPVGALDASALVPLPSADGARAFLVPASTAKTVGAGYWEIGFAQAGDAGPDLDVWSVGGAPLTETARLRFSVI